MRLLKLFKFMAPVGVAALLMSLNPDTSSGQFPGGDRGSRGERSRGGESRGLTPFVPGAAPTGMQFQPTPGSVPGASAVQFQAQPGSFGRGGFGSGGPSGGFGPPGATRGFGGMDPDSSFLRLQQSYGGTGESIDWSKVPASTRERSDSFTSRMGIAPYPTSGVMSREQFREYSTKRMESIQTAMRSGMPQQGMTPGSAAPSGAVTFGGGSTPTTSLQPQSQWPPQGAPGSDPRRGGSGVTDPSQVTDEQVREYMTRYDRDRDGKVSAEEASQSDRLRPVFAMYDQNKDGFIDGTEYKMYVFHRMNNINPLDPNSQSQGSYPQGMYPPGDPRNPQPQEEPKPNIYRYGKLPKEMPAWFTSLDTDKDAQLGVYEWRAGDRRIAEFQQFDLNSDGLITVEEYLRYAASNPSASTASRSGFGGAPGAFPGGSTSGRSSTGEQPRPGGFGMMFGGNRGGSSDPTSSGREKGARPERFDAPEKGGKDKESKLDRREERLRGEGKSKGGNPFSSGN